MNNFWNWAKEHPFLAYFIVSNAISAPANIIKAVKWDGHKPDVNNYYSSPVTETEQNEEAK